MSRQANSASGRLLTVLSFWCRGSHWRADGFLCSDVPRLGWHAHSLGCECDCFMDRYILLSALQATCGIVLCTFGPKIPAVIPTPENTLKFIIKTGCKLAFSIPSFIEVRPVLCLVVDS